MVLVKSICISFVCRCGFDEFHPRFKASGILSASGVGYLKGDLVLLARCGVAIASVEDGLIPEEVDGVPMGASGRLKSFPTKVLCGGG